MRQRYIYTSIVNFKKDRQKVRWKSESNFIVFRNVSEKNCKAFADILKHCGKIVLQT